MEALPQPEVSIGLDPDYAKFFESVMLLWKNAAITCDAVMKKCCYEKDTFAPPPLSLFWKVRGAMPQFSGVPTYRYLQSLSHCITRYLPSVQQSYAEKRQYCNLKWTLSDMFAMLLLPGLAFSRLDWLLPIGPRATPINLCKLTLSIEAAYVVPARGPQYF